MMDKALKIIEKIPLNHKIIDLPGQFQAGLYKQQILGPLQTAERKVRIEKSIRMAG